MYDWIESTFNVSEGIAQGVALIISLAVVLALFALFVVIIKRLMGVNTSQNRGRQPRVAVMDTATVDAKRRLVLIRRDNIEHLLLVGGTSDVVVEQNIVRNAPITASHPRSGAIGIAPQASIKAPTAPGPDIPLTPEDVEPTSPSPSATARLSDISAPQGKPQPIEKPAANTAHGKVAAPTSSAAPSSPLPSKPIATVSPKAITSPAPANPEADLLRAVTKGGPSTSAKPKDAAPAPTASTAIAPTSTVNIASTPAPQVKVEKATAASATTSNPFKNLGNPFSPKNRPSYGDGKISPPASGPAARAKTALAKPLETETDAAPPSAQPDEARPLETGTVAPNGTAQETPTSPNIAVKSPLTTERKSSELAGKPSNDSAAETQSATEVAKIENASASKPEVDAVPTAENAASQLAAVSAPSEEKPAEALAANGTDEQKGKEADKTAGLGERNPIEDEMAKILVELGGQSKQ